MSLFGGPKQNTTSAATFGTSPAAPAFTFGTATLRLSLFFF